MRSPEEILDLGDMSASFRNLEMLRQAVEELFPAVSAPIQVELREVADLIRFNYVKTAVSRWLRVSAHLRAHFIIASYHEGVTPDVVN